MCVSYGFRPGEVSLALDSAHAPARVVIEPEAHRMLGPARNSAISAGLGRRQRRRCAVVHWRGRGKYSTAVSKFFWSSARTQGMIALDANRSCSRRRHWRSATSLSQPRDADRNQPNQGSSLVVAAAACFAAAASAPLFPFHPTASEGGICAD